MYVTISLMKLIIFWHRRNRFHESDEISSMDMKVQMVHVSVRLNYLYFLNQTVSQNCIFWMTEDIDFTFENKFERKISSNNKLFL